MEMGQYQFIDENGGALGVRLRKRCRKKIVACSHRVPEAS
jgi:hypothetical protein